MKPFYKICIILGIIGIVDGAILGAFLVQYTNSKKHVEQEEIVPVMWQPSEDFNAPPSVKILSWFKTTYGSLIADQPLSFSAEFEAGNFTYGNIDGIFVTIQHMFKSNSPYVNFNTMSEAGLNLSLVSGKNYSNVGQETVFFPFAGSFEMSMEIYYTNSTGSFKQFIPLNSTYLTIAPQSEAIAEDLAKTNVNLNLTNTVLTIAIVVFINIESYWILDEQINRQETTPPAESQPN